MTKNKIKYEFLAKACQHAAPNGWYFVSMPSAIASKIREQLQWQEEDWSRLKATALIGNSLWETAIWYNTKHKTYLLPLKSSYNKKRKVLRKINS